MLTRILQLYDEVDALEKDNTRPSEARKKRAALEKEIAPYKRAFPQLRREAQEITDRECVLRVISLFDDATIVSVLLLIIEEMLTQNETLLLSTFQQVTTRDLKQTFQVKTLDDVFSRTLGDTIKSKCGKLMEGNLADIHAEGVGYFFADMASNFYQNAVLRFTRDSQQKKQLFNDLMYNEIFLRYAHGLFYEAEKRHTQNVLSSAFSLIGLTTEKIKIPFAIFLLAIPHLSTTPAMTPMFNELSLWLEGLHQYHFQLVRRAAFIDNVELTIRNGRVMSEKYPAVNTKDKVVRALFGLSLYDLALFNLDVAETLQKRLKPEIACGMGLFEANTSALAAAAAAPEDSHSPGRACYISK